MRRIRSLTRSRRHVVDGSVGTSRTTVRPARYYRSRSLESLFDGKAPPRRVINRKESHDADTQPVVTRRGEPSRRLRGACDRDPAHQGRERARPRDLRSLPRNTRRTGRRVLEETATRGNAPLTPAVHDSTSGVPARAPKPRCERLARWDARATSRRTYWASPRSVPSMPALAHLAHWNTRSGPIADHNGPVTRPSSST